MTRLRIAAWLWLCSCAPTLFAGALPVAAVPEPLQPWIGWALHGQTQRTCPPAHDDADARLCAWPAQIALDLDEQGGRFSLRTRLFAPGWQALPGDGAQWPQSVTVNGRDAPVLAREATPALWLEAGEHRIEGRFEWTRLPESLRVPPEAGLLDLRLSGQALPAPQPDAQQRIWLGERTATEARASTPPALRVFRHVDDGIPLLLTTRIRIDAGGEPREETFGPVLPEGLVPLSLESELPARLDEQQRLRVQLRPGVWTLTLVARARGPVTALTAPAASAGWPAQEIWSLQTRPELRLVEPEGAPRVDPRQTGVPEDWQALPAFGLDAGATLRLTPRQRGPAAAPADALRLHRQWWLDFDGAGYTVQDRLDGELRRSWRLDASAPLALGQVQVDGVPQPLTLHAQRAGVALRQSTLNLSADLRVDEGARTLPVSGWSADVQHVQASLHLPPAWRLLAAPGADTAPDTWLARWTLLDLFLVLVASMAALRLFGVLTGVLMLLALTLSWHEPGAPQWTWLNLLAALALRRALPADLDARGYLRRALAVYLAGALAALLLVAGPFLLQQARVSLYPQLAMPGAPAPSSRAVEAAADTVEPQAAPVAEMAVEAVAKIAAEAPPPPPILAAPAPPPAPVQADLLTQTGPGVPDWQWQQARLGWSGPVTADQSFRVVLLPPAFTRALQGLGLLLFALLGWRLWRACAPRLNVPPAALLAPLLLTGALALGAGLAPGAAWAQSPGAWPPPELLDELRTRLTAPPDCMPGCAQITRLDLRVQPDQLLLRLSLDAQVDTALPLPVPRVSATPARAWQPQRARLDEQPALLRRDAQGALWVFVPAGRHLLELDGSLADLHQVQLPLGLPPRSLRVQASGWRVEGLDAQNQPGAVLDLVRERGGSAAGATAAGPESESGAAFAPLLRVTRVLDLDLAWQLQTTVERMGATQNTLLAQLPAWPGEVITDAAARRVGEQVQVAFAPGQTQAAWTSSLPVTETLTLRAAASADVAETWSLRIAPVWEARFAPLAEVSLVESGAYRPRFQPWPGETLKLHVTRPATLPGASLTLDAAELQVQPGRRITDHHLRLRLRSSRGGQHALPLPEGLSLESLFIDGQAQPPRREQQRLIVPLRPGTQEVALHLRSPTGVETRLRTPALDLNLPGVNARLHVQMPEDRWVLLAGGPALGPSVLFWSVLLVWLALAYSLGRSRVTPLSVRQWALLLVGLSQLPVAGVALVAGWLFALGGRARIAANLTARPFNALQVLLALWTVAALATLFGAVAQGLLGSPDMQIAGNGSHAGNLYWYQDRFDTVLPAAWVVSVPMLAYRVLMLLWALWLANALLRWLRWGWARYGAGGLWRSAPRTPAPTPTDAPRAASPGDLPP